MWTSTVGLINGKHRYLTAETFGFKISANGQQLKRRQQWTIEPFPENTGPDGSISSAASVSSQAACPAPLAAVPSGGGGGSGSGSGACNVQLANSPPIVDANDSCILTLANGPAALLTNGSGQSSSSQAGSSDQDACGEEHENVALRSHLNKYLAVDSFGNVTCDSEDKTENARFTITICSMSQGRSKEEHIFWAFKNVERGYYLGATEDGMICCSAKMPKSRAELWHLHLMPARGATFFAIKSLGRKRFARVTRDDTLSCSERPVTGPGQVQLDANISWGAETLFQFRYFELDGKYSLLTSDQRLLTNEGKCISWPSSCVGPVENNQQQELHHQQAQIEPRLTSSPPPECLFTLEYHSGYLAFRDSFSQYLAAAGRSSVLRSRSIGVSRDELFVFEPAPVQVALKATFNNRWVSIKQGVDLSANQADISGKYETFQLTYHKQTQLWSIMTHDCNYWTISQVTTGGLVGAGACAGSGASSCATNTISVCRPGDYEGLTRGQFKLIWSDTDASFTMKYVNIAGQERWLAARKSGQLYLVGASVVGGGPGQLVEPVRFIMRFQNRRLLNLRPIEGSAFVGLKSASSRQLECTKASPDAIEIEYSADHQMAPVSPINRPTETATATATATPTPTPITTTPTKFTTMTTNEQFANNLEQPRIINVFNVRLNQTKMSPNVFDKLNNHNTQATATATATPTATATAKVKCPPGDEIKCVNRMEQPPNIISDQDQADFNIDANNNSAACEETKLENLGGVECGSAPSVASIISSFSSAKIRDQSQQMTATTAAAAATTTTTTTTTTAAAKTTISEQQQNGKQVVCGRNSTVSKLASSFELAKTNGGAPTHSPDVAPRPEVDLDQHPTGGHVDHVAQAECCYMRLQVNNKYLVQGNESDSPANGPGILCDATNKACAQAWILELRSHNSIAIRASDNHAYLQLGTNGTIYLARCEPNKASLWEF